MRPGEVLQLIKTEESHGKTSDALSAQSPSLPSTAFNTHTKPQSLGCFVRPSDTALSFWRR